MKRVIECQLLTVCICSLLLSACSQVRLQSRESLSTEAYKSFQTESYNECMKNPFSNIQDCQKQKALSYEQYIKERENLDLNHK